MSTQPSPVITACELETAPPMLLLWMRQWQTPGTTAST